MADAVQRHKNAGPADLRPAPQNDDRRMATPGAGAPANPTPSRDIVDPGQPGSYLNLAQGPAPEAPPAGSATEGFHVRRHRPRRFRHRQRPLAQGLPAPRPADQRAGAGHGGAVRRGPARQDRRIPRPPGRRRDAGRTAARGLRRRPRGRQAHPRPAAFRRAAGRRHGAARRQDRRDEDRRGQDPGRHAARLPQRARRQGRPHRHRERLPGPPRRRMDGPDLRLPRHDRRRDRARPGRRHERARSTPPTSPTAPTTSSASTTCATT